MLRLTKKADYSLIALRHFAVRRANLGQNAAASAKEVSDSSGVPLPVLSKLLQKLGRSGFLTAVQGTNGGYRLARDPALISVLEVISAIDGPIVLANCFTAEGACGFASQCTVKRPLRRIHEGIMRLLSGVSIQDMVLDENAALPNGLPNGSSTLQKIDTGKVEAPKMQNELNQVRTLTI